MTLFKVIDLIKILALKHPNVNSAEEGDIYSILNANTQQKYASVVLTQDTHTEDEVFDNYNFNIFYVDRLFSDIETNRLDIQSTAKNVLSNIIRAFCEEFDAECNSINYHTFTERFADECAGAYAAITISIPKDIYCTEKYWDGNWSAPVISIKNQDKKVEFTENGTFTITYDNENFTGLGTVEVEVNVEDSNGSYEEGYTKGLGDGIADGIYHQKSKLESITITENGVYEKEDGYDEITVNVIDTNGSYQEGYLDGETDGYNDGLADGIGEGRSYQKSLLGSITIKENGVYEKEDGYNKVIVDVEDTNGSYSEGYEDGIEKGIENAAEIIAENAQVLNITESGIYTTKYTKDEDVQITGYFDDGTQFYNYAQLIDQRYRSNTKLNQNSVIEFWWKPDLTENYAVGTLIDLNKDTYSNNVILQYNTKNAGSNQEKLGLSINSNFYSSKVQVTDKWYHIKIDFTNGFFIDGEKNNDINIDWNVTNDYFYINNIGQNLNASNGYFGMIKIDGNTYIPTVNGYVDVLTNTPLYVYSNGTYNFSEGAKYAGDNLIRTVNVQPKINIAKEKIKFGYADITTVPEWADFEGITDMSDMFIYCSNLTTIPHINTSNVTKMSSMLSNCINLETIPLIDTSKVTKFEFFVSSCSKLEHFPQIDTSSATNIRSMFSSCKKLISIAPLNVYNVTRIDTMFGYSQINTLTDIGGFLNLRCKWDDNYGLKSLPNLTYESCINVLNGLYDFTGNGETPSSSQGILKVHANFLSLVGDEISIGTDKGWTITA